MSRIVLTAVFLVSAAGGMGHAASCDQRASQLASEQGGQVVSVQAIGSECEIKLLIPSSSGPPVRRTFMVPK